MFEAVWPGVITLDELHAVRAAVKRRAHKSRRGSRKYLLTAGIAICGRCEANVVARPREDGRRAYYCTKEAGGCGRLGALADPFEELVAGMVIAALDGDDLDALATPDPAPVLAELREIDAQVAALTEQMTAGNVPPTVYSDAAATLGERRRALESALDVDVSPLDGIGGTLAAAWPDLDVQRRQEIVRLVIERVIIHPAVRGRNTFDPDRFEVIWRA